MKGINLRVYEVPGVQGVIGLAVTTEEPPFYAIAYVEARPGRKPLVTLVKPEAVRVNSEIVTREDRGYDFRLLNVDPYRGAQA
jgi:hypothetical protein